MKILKERFPKGTLKGQMTDGRYIDGFLWENIDILGKNIVRDMTYLIFICSSTLEVGTGKSVFAQQLAEAYLESVRQHHGIDNNLTMNNIVFRPKDLITRAFDKSKISRYSVIILDEWEDAHYWSELGMTLRQFFRKCRQLNLLIICIIPNFFQLPINYATSRSVCLIDVKFSGEFKRGYFSFYNFDAKKILYIQGKKTQNYKTVKPNFSGRFTDGYVVDEMEYRKEKYLDMIRSEKEEKKTPTEKQTTIKLFIKLRTNLPQLSVTELSKAFGITATTGYEWLKKEKERDVEVSDSDFKDITINPNDYGIEIEPEPEPEE